MYEETTCDTCREEKVCRRTESGTVTAWVCLDCQQAAQHEAQAAADAQFDMMCFRLPSQDGQAVAGLQQGAVR